MNSAHTIKIPKVTEQWLPVAEASRELCGLQSRKDQTYILLGSVILWEFV